MRYIYREPEPVEGGEWYRWGIHRRLSGRRRPEAMDPLISFPVLAIGPDTVPSEGEGRGHLAYFENEKDFSRCYPWELKEGVRLGMMLVDRTGRCWMVQSVIDRGEEVPWLHKIIWFLLRVHRIDQRVIEVQAMSLDEIKERVVRSIRVDPDRWWLKPENAEADLAELEASIRKAPSVLEIINELFGTYYSEEWFWESEDG